MKTVIHVEDMQGEREVIELLYQQCHARFHGDVDFVGLASWAECLDYLEHHAVDVIVLDLILPPFDADQTLGQMQAAQKADPGFPPVVILTGNQLPETRRKAILAGADDFIVKQDLHGHAERLCERVYLSFLRRLARTPDDPRTRSLT